MLDDFGDLTLPNDFGDLTLCVSPKHSLGIGCSQFATQNVGEPHPRVLAIKVTTYCYLLPR
ncbi:hypothetical protein H5410_014400 [Solanum commersonii]|uniref:Uncharacterized protein n=1 Tax=Solanum commersonii TaxID=4109 RepID=A0A9J5ZQX3_SOLCO|nr:hypothetical protein H5410_014400 [Solanum commersonii]